MDLEQQLQQRGFCVVDVTAQLLQSRHFPEKYTIMVFCTGGKATLEVNMERVSITAGTRVCYTHVLLMHLLDVSDDFRAVAVVVMETFAFDAVVGVETETLQSLFTTPIRTINDSRRWQLLLTLVESIRLYAAIDTTPYHSEISRSLFRNMMIVLGEDAGTSDRHPGTTGYTMADTYFRKFISLIYEHVHQEHEVAYYAGCLHITSKYLNEICKLKSNHKAKEIISSILATFIKRELMYSSKSMKELAAEFNFADQSSLGKFFRKLTGQSPLAYKQQQL